MLPARNGRVRQIASQVAVSFRKAPHGVPSVANADVQPRIQSKIVANVTQRSTLIVPLKGVERDDGRVR